MTSWTTAPKNVTTHSNTKLKMGLSLKRSQRREWRRETFDVTDAD
jgi:hypothetical protein